MRSLQPVPYASQLASNLRAARGAANLSQSDVGERMRALGFTAWLRSTVSLAEQGKRRVTAEELLGLALALETEHGPARGPSRGEAVDRTAGGATGNRPWRSGGEGDGRGSVDREHTQVHAGARRRILDGPPR